MNIIAEMKAFAERENAAMLRNCCQQRAEANARDERRARVKDMLNEGLEYLQISQTLGVSRQLVRKDAMFIRGEST